MGAEAVAETACVVCFWVEEECRGARLEVGAAKGKGSESAATESRLRDCKKEIRPVLLAVPYAGLIL